MPDLLFDLTLGADRARIARVLAIIRSHIGRENAIPLDAIEAETGVKRRDIQSIVKFLVEERGHAIGTAVKAPFGLYRIVTEAELEANYLHFLRRGVSTLRHARAFRKNSVVGPIVGQLEIEIGDRKDQ